MNKGSKYWGKKFDLIELDHTQHNITNFVKILTGDEIPV